MKKFLFLPFLLFLLIYGPQTWALQAGLQQDRHARGALTTPSLQAGTGKQTITPVAGTPLGGFGKRHGRPSQGVHDPLFARALALTRGDQTIIFVSADLVLIDAGLRKAVLKKVRGKLPLGEDQLVLTATHTHSGSGAYGGRLWQKFILGKKRKKVFEFTVGKIAAAIVQSLESRIPVNAEYAETDLGNLVENRMDEKLKDPHPLRVLRFKTPEGKITAALIFMAAHPTLLPASNLLFSADFPGVLCGRIEQESPNSVALFVNGAAADLRPHAPDIQDRFERMEAYGMAIAEKFQNLSFAPAPLDGPWQSILEKKKLPRVKIRLGKFRVPGVLGARVFPRHSFFQVIRMGQMLIFAFPGELGSEPGREVEKHIRARGFIPLIAGYANDYIAYVISPRHYADRSQYEARVSFYGSKMSWWTEQTAIDLTEKVLSESEKNKTRPEGEILRRASPAQDDSDLLLVLKLRGDPYHVGFEEGRLLKKEIHQAVEDISGYLRRELPIPLANQWLIHFSMDRAWKKMEPFISYSEYLQIKGLADGSGISLKTMKRMHALPEVYPSWCTNGAYWGKATQSGRMIAIRNLDWNRQIGIHRHAAVKFIETPGQHAYVNIGYAGFSGVLSGMNDAGISAGQVGAASADETLKGTPMPFLLKRVLEETGSLKAAEAVFKQSERTRGYNYVIASALEKKALVLETTHHHLAVFEDNDEKENADYAFKMPDAVFRGDPALDPAIRNLQWASKGNPQKPGLEPPQGSAYEIRYRKHGQLVLGHYGKITPEIAMQMARELAPGSNIQSVIYAFPEFWVANARGELKAAETEYVHFDFEELKS